MTTQVLERDSRDQMDTTPMHSATTQQLDMGTLTPVQGVDAWCITQLHVKVMLITSL